MDKGIDLLVLNKSKLYLTDNCHKIKVTHDDEGHTETDDLHWIKQQHVTNYVYRVTGLSLQTVSQIFIVL